MRNVKVLWGLIVVLLIAVVILSSALTAHTLQQPDPDKHSDQSQDDGEARIVATVGTKNITLGDVKKQLLQKHGHQQLDHMIDQEVIRIEAETQGILVSESEVQQELKRMQQGYDSESQFYELMREQLGFTPEALKNDVYHKLLGDKITIQGIIITDQEVSAYMGAHQEEFEPRVQLRLQHIVAANREQAQRALDDLARGEDFAQVAKERSLDDATRDSGGDLGWLEDDDPFIHPAVMEAAISLKPGEVSKPMEADGRYVIVRVAERKEQSKGSPEVLREQVRKELALREAPPLNDALERLRKKWNVTLRESF
ncbi:MULTISPECIES: peptidyl-prolyl cis-trans isomerase [unclassified Paenibacillus]|uniref:peptidyl-prolyl cis-trans isomerase n=1 Tax=unclassified Paenibacillus TaxID=185978 RepID=UPI001AE2E11C|nr:MULTISPECIES: peptidyl-prolyl cis-trans isomerase [unclassified Paenibacillus]MBP1153505.1 foldase protein PrsA [Paenibacillus sp. PvP091]MBP1171112.1 foldase protein PrsA [Paenibacillus sp. PvR098]MBP2442140.1 foldase protein PrsA [Paenibacillus sp. PvP052]